MSEIERLEAKFDEKDIKLDKIKKCRKQEYINIRVLYSYVARKNGITVVDIGKRLGLNHATIVYYLKTFQDRMTFDVSFKKFIKEWVEFI